MTEPLGKLAFGTVAATIALACVISGCSSQSASHHVDCHAVKLQTDAGHSDDEIASSLSTTVGEVARCHGVEPTGKTY